MTRYGHTPGPWRSDALRETKTGRAVITAQGLDPIAIVHNGNLYAEDDAALIASAPDLLAACEYALLQIEHCDCSNGVLDGTETLDEGTVKASHFMDDLRALIRKAKGQTR